MLFFQTVLLLGYGYAHFIARLKPAFQTLLQVLLFAVAWLFIPPLSPDGVPHGMPVFWLLTYLIQSLALPFVFLASLSPLLQKWFSQLSHDRGNDPYFLYAASNTGSLGALLCYPFIAEPLLSLSGQTRFWSIGYFILGLFVLLCAAFTFIKRKDGSDPQEDAAIKPVLVTQKIRWILLAFVPASLMYGVTVHITTDIAAAPLLWIIPLSLYLLTFILVFSKTGAIGYHSARRFFPFVVIPLTVILLFGPKIPVGLSLFWHLLSFFVMTLFCHGELAMTRPSTRHLTEFYFWLSLGGVLGGVFNTLIAPVLFITPVEYHIAIVLACFMRTETSELRQVVARWVNFILPLSVGLLLWAVALLKFYDAFAHDHGWFGYLYLPLAAAISFSFRFYPVRMLLGIACVSLIWLLPSQSRDIVYADRSFFGVHRIKKYESNNLFAYLNGNVIHGVQSNDANLHRIPATYYHPSGPAGDIVNAFRETGLKQAAVVGLGVGSMAAYARSGEEWVFFEIDPAAVDVAKHSGFFTFLKNAQGDIKIEVIDGRLGLLKSAGQSYGLILLDAFSSDSIPVHILTAEAIQMYASKLKPGGIMAFHISNRYLDLEPILADIAVQLGLEAKIKQDIIKKDLAMNQLVGKESSIWMILAEPGRMPNIIANNPAWHSPAGTYRRIWSDDYSDIVSAFKPLKNLKTWMHPKINAS